MTLNESLIAAAVYVGFYLLQLAVALRELGDADPHVAELEQLLACGTVE